MRSVKGQSENKKMIERTVGSGNVFADMGRSPDQSVNLKIRSKLMIHITDFIEDQGLTQAQAAKVFGVTQPRVSNLVRGKIKLFSIDMLVEMAVKAGMKVEVDVYA